LLVLVLPAETLLVLTPLLLSPLRARRGAPGILLLVALNLLEPLRELLSITLSCLAIVPLGLHRLLDALLDLLRVEALTFQLLDFLLANANLLQTLPDLLFLLPVQLLASFTCSLGGAITILLAHPGAVPLLILICGPGSIPICRSGPVLLLLLPCAVLLARIILLAVLSLGEGCRRNHQPARHSGNDGCQEGFLAPLHLDLFVHLYTPFG
jgi:hypothetical protein